MYAFLMLTIEMEHFIPVILIRQKHILVVKAQNKPVISI